MKYIYSATGEKLSQEVYSPGLTKKSDYIGEFFYENDQLQFITTEEGRVVMADGTPEYQYMLKDHLGNNRITFTTKPKTDTYTATLETDTQSQEENDFSNYSATVNDLLDHTDSGTVYSKALVLNGGYNGQVGLAKSFSVVPGDVVEARVYAKYVAGTGPASNLNNFAVALSGAFGLSPVQEEGFSAYQALNGIGSLIASGDRDDDDGAPKGFINILVFDKNYTLIDFAYEQIGSEYIQTGSVKAPHQLLTAHADIKQPVYVYVFLSNEGATEQQIGFDDLTVEHGHSDVVQAEEYYPFGLTFNGYQRENSIQQPYLFNGKEQQDELNVGWLDYGARMYMSDIGRWGGIDPLAHTFIQQSTYEYAFCNPIRYIDPTGMSSEEAKGNEEGSDDKKDPDEPDRRGEVTKDGNSWIIALYYTNFNDSDSQDNTVEGGATGDNGTSFGPSNWGPAPRNYIMRNSDVNHNTLFQEFLTGEGHTYSGFGQNHSMTVDLKRSWIVGLARIKQAMYPNEPLFKFNAPYGILGLIMSTTMTEEFVGGATISIIPTSEGRLFIVENTTGRYSYQLHTGTDIERDPTILTPKGNIYQKFVWLEKD